MRLVWHIGPHKTGTTALQHALRNRATAADCGYFYPAPSLVADIAHAQIAWRFLGLAGCVRDRDIVLRKVAAAERNGFRTLVLSSEEFSRALFVDDRFESFADVANAVQTELVITLSPLADRVLPEWQEAVKHGATLDPENTADLERLGVSRPGLRPEFLEEVIQGCGKAAVTVIFVDKQDPDKIFRGMSQVLGEPLPPPSSPIVNPSAPLVKMLWLSAFNKCFPDVPWETSRVVVDAAYGAARAGFDRIELPRRPTIPQEFAGRIARVWDAQRGFLRTMEERGRVTCL